MTAPSSRSRWADRALPGAVAGTVRKHLEHIYARLEVNSRTEAVACARSLLAS